MPFGLHRAPPKDRLVVSESEYAAAYLDDMVIHSGSWKDHIRHEPKKCQIAMKRCIYLGHVVGNGEVRPDESKLHAVENFPSPTTKKQVRAFLGLTGYYRKFIADSADIAVGLTDLTRKNAPNRVKWTTPCEEAFKIDSAHRQS